MELHVNRRIREKAMVFGLPAERFMLCFALMCAPVVFVLFLPILTPVWILWAAAVYWFFRNAEHLLRRWSSGKQFPTHLKNR